MTGTVRVELDGAVARVALSNPGRRNAVSWSMLTSFGDVVGDLGCREDVAVVVLAGDGADFCVGADLAAAPDQRTLRRDSIAADTERLAQVTASVVAFHRLPQVTIAAIDGGCAGAGLSLALAADLRIASDRVVLSTAFLGAGVSGDLGSAWFLSQVVGADRARRLLLDPRRMDAHEAQSLDLVSRVVAAGTLAGEASTWAHRIASQAPLALRGAKQNLLDAADHDLDTYTAHEVRRMVATFHTQDAEEAAAAFLARRTPLFTGR